MAKGVQYHNIANACEKLQSEGKNITFEAVREVLGNTGSYTTINLHLKAWKSTIIEQKLKNGDDVTELPITRRVDKKKNDTRIYALEEENAALKFKVEMLEKDVIKATAEIEALKKTTMTITKMLEDIRAEISWATEGKKALTNLVDTLSDPAFSTMEEPNHPVPPSRPYR